MPSYLAGSRIIRNQRGTSTLEFIVVLPVLLFVLFAIVEISRAYLTVNLVTTAAREGARAGAVAPAANVTSYGVARIDEMPGGPWTYRTVSCDPAACEAGAEVTATVRATFQTVVPLLLPAMFQNLTIEQTAVARHE
jgi:Flp pilus assembly protein TadG